MKYTRKKRKGGTNEIDQKLQSYVLQMKNKENINYKELKLFLDGISNPLKRTILLDETQEKYTINEWAIIYECNIKIHFIFENYEAFLYKRVKYPYHVFYSNEKYNILEAYILQGLYINNINCIITQIENDTSLIENVLFYKLNDFPTVLTYAIEMSTYKNANISKIICSLIIKLYSNPDNYIKLTDGENKSEIMKLIYYAITNKVYDLITYIIMHIHKKNMYTNENAFENLIINIFHPSLIEKIILIDDFELYKTIIDAVNLLDNQIFINELVQYYTNNDTNKIDKYIKNGKLNTDMARSFFKKVAQHSIKNLEIREIGNAPKIIIICHGVSLGNHKIHYSFPFSRLCFFVSEGNKLKDECIVGRQVEELICAGKYDLRLKCTDGVSGEISLEDMRFKFFAETYEHKRNGTLGFHYCFRKRVEKIDEFTLDKEVYTMEELLEKCSLVCEKMFIQKEYVEILMFVCRGYIDAPEISEHIKADAVITPQSI